MDSRRPTAGAAEIDKVASLFESIDLGAVAEGGVAPHRSASPAHRATRPPSTSRDPDQPERPDLIISAAGHKGSGARVTLSSQVDAFAETLRPLPWEHELRTDVVECFRRIVVRVWPMANVHTFGSFHTGMYLPDGDFDIVIEDRSLATANPRTHFLTLRKALVHARFVHALECEVVTAKVPLLKFKTRSEFGSFRFDVSLSFDGNLKGPNGAEKALRYLDDLEKRQGLVRERVYRLVLLVKNLLETNRYHLVKHGGLGGFSIFCICIWYFQCRRLIPGLDETLPDLHIFFILYGLVLPVRDVAICLENGGSYFRKLDRGWHNPRHPLNLSIQHPIEPTRDLSSGSYRWDEIRSLFLRNLQIMTTWSSPSTRGTRPTILPFLGLGLDPGISRLRASRRVLFESGALKTKATTWMPREPATSISNGNIGPVPRTAHRSATAVGTTHGEAIFRARQAVDSPADQSDGPTFRATRPDIGQALEGRHPQPRPA
ncbi:hypothetical protein JCM10212_000107 [Sporobolomyces blumeae]